MVCVASVHGVDGSNGLADGEHAAACSRLARMEPARGQQERAFRKVHGTLLSGSITRTDVEDTPGPAARTGLAQLEPNHSQKRAPIATCMAALLGRCGTLYYWKSARGAGDHSPGPPAEWYVLRRVDGVAGSNRRADVEDTPSVRGTSLARMAGARLALSSERFSDGVWHPSGRRAPFGGVWHPRWDVS